MAVSDFIPYVVQTGAKTTVAPIAAIILASVALLSIIYRLALPKPFPGIPYNALSAANLFGDVPAMLSHMAKEDGTFITYLTRTLQNLNSPLVQVFIKPMGKPLLILSDFREANDIMSRRTKEFDRSTSSGDLVRGLGPSHHIHLKTTAAWRAQRRLIQDLMSVSFLHDVAAPAIHEKAIMLIKLWQSKTKVANGRPWSAAEDIDNVALDAVLAFAFGEQFGQRYSAIRPLKAVNLEKNQSSKVASSPDEPFKFPEHQADEAVRATLELVETVQEVQGSPLPDLKWAYVNMKPRVKRATKVKEEYINHELTNAVKRLQSTKGESIVKSAVELMVSRETTLAEKESRKPDYLSRVMVDEIFGFIVAGNDTSSAAISWGLKYLTVNAASQKRLRDALAILFPDAKAERRTLTINEITSKQIPYLDAVIEETLRCAASVPVVDRQAIVDTELLGHRIPKGTVVTCLVTGPSMTSPNFDIDEARRSETSRAVKMENRVRTWDPEEMASFHPERWLAAKEEGQVFDAAAGPQLAFGQGTRQCFGKRLAYLEMRILIALIVWNFELLPCPPALSGNQPILIMTNRPKHCYVRLREVDWALEG